jgi:hypothetical protein
VCIQLHPSHHLFLRCVLFFFLMLAEWQDLFLLFYFLNIPDVVLPVFYFPLSCLLWVCFVLVILVHIHCQECWISPLTSWIHLAHSSYELQQLFFLFLLVFFLHFPTFLLFVLERLFSLFHFYFLCLFCLGFSTSLEVGCHTPKFQKLEYN